MSALPHLAVDVAAAVGARIVPPGPSLSSDEADAVVAGLRRAAEASVDAVADITRLGAPAGGPMLVVDRAGWVRANAGMVATMLAEASGEPLPAADRLRDTIAGRANGAQLGAALAVLGTRILGQYLPFTSRPELVLVAPTIAQIERELDVPRDDFRLWVCLHEQTHRQQFARAPWLRGHLLAAMGDMLSEDTPRHRRDRPASTPRARGSVLDLVTTPAQRAVLERVGATMSLLEGYADDMMDRVGPRIVPSVATIRRRFNARRSRGGWTRILNGVLGMDLKLAQYRDGARFCRAVIARTGVDGLNVVYDAPAHLPDAAEIADPARWIRRVHG